MNIFKGIYLITKLNSLNKKQKVKAIFYGIAETILNAPKNLTGLIAIGIGSILEIIGKISDVFLDYANWVKWDSKDLTITPKEFKIEFENAIKDYAKENKMYYKK